MIWSRTVVAPIVCLFVLFAPEGHLRSAEIARQPINASAWVVIGLFAHQEDRVSQTSLPPEKEIKLDASYRGTNDNRVFWRQVVWLDGQTSDYIDLERILGGWNGVAFAFTTIYSPSDRIVRFCVDADGELSLSLNGTSAALIEKSRERALSSYSALLALNRGWNSVLLRITGDDRLGFSAELTSEDASLLADLECYLPERVYSPNVAALLSSVVPGPGQVYLSEGKSAALFMSGELLLLSAGLLIDRHALSEWTSSTGREGLDNVLSNPPLLGAMALPYLSAYLAYRDARQANHNIGYPQSLAEDSLADIVRAPVDWDVIGKKDFIAPFLLHLSATLAIIAFLDGDNEANSQTPDRMSSTVRVFHRNVPASLGYPLGEMGIFAGSVATAAGEEAFFRGYVQSELESRLGQRWGWLCASALFGALHFGNGDTTKTRLISTTSATVAGLVLGRFYQQTHYSIRKSVAYHAWWNFAVSTIDFIQNPKHSAISGTITFGF